MNPGLSYAHGGFVVARNPAEGTILLGGLGAVGVGQMWFTEDEAHKDYPGYADAEIIDELATLGEVGRLHPDTPKVPTPYELHLEHHVANLEAEVERLTAELGNQEAVMVAADRLWTAYQAMLDGEDVGRLPEWEK